MTRKTHRTETHIETHEIKIIRFGTKRVGAESDHAETPPARLITEHASGHNCKDLEDSEASDEKH